MKKLLIILINLILFILLFICVDYFSAKYQYYISNKNISEMMKNHKDFDTLGEKFKSEKFRYNLQLIHFKKFWDEQRKHFDNERRVVKPKNINKNGQKAIIVFGCSFAEGAFLEDNETFEYKLSNLTNYTVYNRGFSGFGLGQMVWQTKQKEFYEDIKEPVDYVIYIYILDHLRRIYEHKYGHINVYLGYEENNGKLIEKNPLTLQLNRFYLISNFFQNIIFSKIYLNKKNDDKNFDLIKLHFEEARKELQKRYPNVKFIIIKHPFGVMTSNDMDSYSLLNSYTTKRWQELEDEGFLVYDLKDVLDVDITSDEYTFPDGHPNEKAWNIVTKKLVKDLNL